MKTLLVATDLTAGSDAAILRALSLSDELEARVSVLHVVERPTVAARVEQQLRALLGSTAATLEQGEVAAVQDAEQALRARLSGVSRERRSVEWTVSVGSPAASIAERAAAVDAELIVVGPGSRAGVLGSIAERVVKRSARAVLIARSTAPAPYSSVLVGVNFSDASLRALELARQLTPGARCVVVFASEPIFEQRLRWAGADDAARASFRNQLAELVAHDLSQLVGVRPGIDQPPEAYVRFGLAADVITEHARLLRADLIALGATSVGGIGQHLIGSVAARVARESDRDVLLIP